MTHWYEYLIDTLADTSSESELFHRLKTLSRSLGFEHCSYGMRTPLPTVAPKFSLFSDYPDAWSQLYVTKNYFSIDPTVAHALKETTPLLWSSDKPIASLEFWEEAQQHQLRHGWCMPSRGHYGTVGLLTFVRSAEVITRAELDTKEHQMIALTMLAHSAMSQMLAPKQMPECTQALTPRERQVLQWLASGKTYSETGRIIQIDERTVKFHLGNAMRKLNAVNKAQATFKAAVLGLL